MVIDEYKFYNFCANLSNKHILFWKVPNLSLPRGKNNQIWAPRGEKTQFEPPAGEKKKKKSIIMIIAPLFPELCNRNHSIFFFWPNCPRLTCLNGFTFFIAVVL